MAKGRAGRPREEQKAQKLIEKIKKSVAKKPRGGMNQTAAARIVPEDTDNR